MRILGLQFGHDAGIAVVEDGRVVFLAHAERILRRKKTSGLSYDLIKQTLERAGLKPEQIDYCAVVTTQGMDIILDDRKPFSVEIARHPRDKFPSPLEAAAQAQNVADPRAILHPDSLTAGAQARMKKRLDPIQEELNIPAAHARVIPSLNRSVLATKSAIAKEAPLRALSEGMPDSTAPFEAARFDFHYPATVVLDGHRIPAALVGHHAAHAAGTFYQSPHDTAAIMTLDGGIGLREGGMFWLGQNNRIVPLRAHRLMLGAMYLWASHDILNLGGSAEGKMMGLAPYGQPAIYHERLIGNGIDQVDGKLVRDAWVELLQDTVKGSARYQPSDRGNPDKMTAPINADIAASVQKLFEETMLTAVDQLDRILTTIGAETDNLALSGGCMLNCPTNTRIFRETRFRNVHVEPACDDGGLPAGAALWVYYNLFERPRTPTDPVSAGVPYLGLPLKDGAIPSALAAFADRVTVTPSEDLAAEGARRLAAGQVIGWFEGRSEIGPRALGHRSIVADPRGAETWARVNTIKGRELWRPLAPSVLEEHAHAWFKGLPARSPFMMFVGEVIRDDVPAIAHIDKTARVQTVSKECGGYYALLTAFHKLTGCAVVLNTSMNGPGEPIAEYPEDAIRMLLDGRFDALAIGDAIVERKT